MPSTFTVNTVLDVVKPRDGKLSLREAITQAFHHPGPDTIALPAGVFRLSAPLGAFEIQDNVLIQGAGAGVTVIDGQQQDRLFFIAGSAPHSVHVAFQGLTLRNGFANSPQGGGAILVGNADLVVRDCVIAGNRTSGRGGGISNSFLPGTGNITLIHCTVSGNISGDRGGGIDVIGAGPNQVSVLFVNGCSVRGNQAISGGGILAATLVMTDSTVRGNSADKLGGGIRFESATFSRCTVLGNHAGINGGGMFGSTVTLNQCAVVGNASVDSGGGIVADTALLIRSNVRGNSAVGDGGGVLAFADATLFKSTVVANVVRHGNGGGINSSAGSITVMQCTIQGNVATFDGGGINAQTAKLINSTVRGNMSTESGGGGVDAFTATLTNCTINGNVAGAGSGGGFAGVTVTLTNCTVSGNIARFNGGGIFASDKLTLLNVTITQNHAHQGGGVFMSTGGTAPADVKNSIIAQNFVDAAGAGPDVWGAFASQGHNLIGIVDGNSTGFFAVNTNGDLVGAPTQPIDARLVPLANNGGPTFTHALKKGSLAIDHGDNTGAPTRDQRGILRPIDGDGNHSKLVDIGAFEKN